MWTSPLIHTPSSDESLKSLQEKLKCDHLCEELAEEKRELKEDPLPSEKEMMEFRNYLDVLIDKGGNLGNFHEGNLKHLEEHQSPLAVSRDLFARNMMLI